MKCSGKFDDHRVVINQSCLTRNLLQNVAEHLLACLITIRGHSLEVDHAKEMDVAMTRFERAEVQSTHQ